MDLDREGVQSLLRTVIQMIGLIPTDALEEHVVFARNQIERFDSIGPIVDPTAWRTARATGADVIERGRVDMIGHVLSIRQLLDADEAKRQEALEKMQTLPPMFKGLDL